ncbi:MAG: hypothetical protein JWM95_3030 [Gemmatimonadetes bacterium]|nr:hypothetical protein [Gemmatimonadota bacterium]
MPVNGHQQFYTIDHGLIDSLRVRMINALRSDSVEWTSEAGDGEHGLSLPELERVFAQAQDQEIRIEQALVLLKEIWATSPQRIQLRFDIRARTFDHLITACIKAYFHQLPRADLE